MAISKQYMKEWNYDPDDTTGHVSRAGLALLPEGIEWRTRKAYKETFATEKWKLHSVNSILADTNVATATPDVQTLQSIQAADVHVSSGPAYSNQHGLPRPPDGMVAIDSSGNALTPLSKPETCVDAAARGRSLMQSGATDHHAGALESKFRTTRLWRTINPGCMPDYTSLPISTSHETFTVDYSCIPRVDKRVHRQKNEFTEHTEQGASIMKALISDKK